MSLHRKPKSQQAFLREAMQRMDMDEDQFARRIGASRRRLDNWLTNPGDAGYAELDPVIWTFVREIMERAVLAESRSPLLNAGLDGGALSVVGSVSVLPGAHPAPGTYLS